MVGQEAFSFQNFKDSLYGEITTQIKDDEKE